MLCCIPEIDLQKFLDDLVPLIFYKLTEPLVQVKETKAVFMTSNQHQLMCFQI